MRHTAGRGHRRRKFGTVWGELEYVCRKIHYWLYDKNDKAAAKRYQSRLTRLLHKALENDLAILREEGLALLHELKGENASAIQHRKREIELTERLHNSVCNSVKAGNYDEGMGASILVNRDATVLQKRRAILKVLEQRDTQPGP